MSKSIEVRIVIGNTVVRSFFMKNDALREAIMLERFHSRPMKVFECSSGWLIIDRLAHKAYDAAGRLPNDIESHIPGLFK
jgi:hypothetical protein